MNDQELEILLNDMESDRVERKASISDRGKLCEAICAFANDLPNHQKPGVLFIGVNDNGTCANLTITDYRNPHLAEAMKNLGYVQRFGLGIELARQQLLKNGNPPLEFTVEDAHVLVTVKKKS